MSKDIRVKIKFDKDSGQLIIASKELDKFNSTIKNADLHTNNLNKTLISMAKVGGGIYAVKQAYDLLNASVSTLMTVSANFEKQQSILKTLEGDSQKAKNSFEWIKTFAKNTPYEINKVTDAFIKAKSYGIEPTSGTLKTLGDTASAMGKDINDAVEAMADAMVGENERLKEFGIKASIQGDKVTYSWISASGKAKNIIVDNNSKIIQSTLNSIFNSKYQGAMTDMMNTWNGMVSNMSDNYTNFIYEIATQSGVFDALKGVVVDINTQFDSILSNEVQIKAIGNVLSDSIGGMSTFITTSLRFINGGRLLAKEVSSYLQAVKLGGLTMIKDLELQWLLFTRNLRVSTVEALGFDNAKTLGIDTNFTQQQKQIAQVQQQKNDLIKEGNNLLIENQRIQNDGRQINQILLDLNAKVHENLNKYTNDLNSNTDAIKNNNKAKKDFGNDGTVKTGSSLVADYNKAAVDEFYKIQEKELKLKIADIEFDSSAFDDAIDKQLALIDATNQWGNTLGGVAGQIGNVFGAMANMQKANLKALKVQNKTETTWAKAKEKYTENDLEYYEAQNKYILETSDNTVASNDAQMQGYIGLGNVMSNFFEQGSQGAQVLQVAMMALQMPSLIAGIMNQAKLVYPYNIIAMAGTAALGFALMGKGGGAGASSSPMSAEQMQTSKLSEKMIEMTNQPMLDRLDRQIELLEIIGLEGTASKIKIDQAALQNTTDIDTLSEKIIQSTQTTTIKAGDGNTFSASELSNIWDTQFSKVNETLDADLYSLNEATNSVTFNAQVYREKGIEAIAAIFDNGLLPTLANWLEATKAGATTQEQITAFAIAKGKEWINQYQDITQEYVMSMSDVTDGMKDAKDSFIEFYDGITGTFKYSTQELNEAFEDVNKISGGDLPSYLEKNIKLIQDLENEFGGSITDIFLSQDPKDLLEQQRVLEDLEAQFGKTFASGVEEALNNLDSIELVTEAMTTSTSNIKDFIKSFMTHEQLLRSQGADVGMFVAESYEDLISQFDKLANDTLGLTDKELEYLEANKDYLDELYEENIDTLNEQINSLDNVFNSIANTIEKLRDSTLTSEATLAKFFTTLQDAKDYLSADDYESFEETINKALGYSSALFDTKNFTSSKEMSYAQLTTANELDALGITVSTEKDLLQEISDNTAETVNVLLLQLSEMGANITDALDALNMDMATGTADEYIRSIYDTYGLTQDDAGISYWSSQASSGAVSTDNLGLAIATAGAVDNNISREDYVTTLYTQGLGRTPTAEEVNYWTNESQTATTDLASLFSQLDPTFTAFANGGIVTAPTLGLIGEAGYNEAVIPLKDPNDPLQMNAVIDELKVLRSELQEIKTNTKNTSTNTQTSRFA